MLRSYLVVSLICLFLSPPLAAAEPAEKLPEFTKRDWKSLDVIPIKVEKEESGFIVGGKNETALIKTLKSIHGRTIAELEQDMRPEAKSEVGSSKGFLGKEEKLLDVLVADNQFVVEERKLTHQELARHLLALAALGARQKGEPFRYEGVRYKVTISHSRGFQLSPFYDDTKTNTVAAVENLDTQAKLTYSLLVPQMIERYGFYEGTGTPYRLDPKLALELLTFLKP